MLNSANEVAVDAFLGGRIGFLDITRSVATCLEMAVKRGLIIEPNSLEDVLNAEVQARELAQSVIGTGAGAS